MAMQQPIPNPDAGWTAEYWRITDIQIALLEGPQPLVRYQVSGYASAEIRARPTGRPIAHHNLAAVGAEAVALMQRSAGSVLRSKGVNVDAWPADSRAAVDALTIYDQCATVLYADAVQRVPALAGAVDV